MFRTDTVVQVTSQYTILHDISLLSFYTFIIEVYRTTIERNRTVIYHTDMFITYFLVQLIGKDRNILTVEISFKRMSDSFVQQNTRTAGCHHHREFTTFRLNGFKHNCCIVYNFASYHFDDIICHKFKTFTIGTSGIVIFHTSVLFHNTESHIGYHRTVIIVSHTF